MFVCFGTQGQGGVLYRPSPLLRSLRMRSTQPCSGTWHRMRLRNAVTRLCQHDLWHRFRKLRMSPDVCPERTISGMYARLHAAAVTADLICCAAADRTVPAVQVEERLEVAAQHGPVVLEREVAAAAAASEPNQPPTKAAVRTAARMRHRVSPKAEHTRRTPRCYSTVRRRS